MKCYTMVIFIIVCQAISIFMNNDKPYVYGCQKDIHKYVEVTYKLLINISVVLSSYLHWMLYQCRIMGFAAKTHQLNIRNKETLYCHF